MKKTKTKHIFNASAQASNAARLLAENDYRSAEALLESLLRKQPDDPELIGNLAIAKAGLFDFESAAKLTELAYSKSQGDLDYICNLCAIYRKSGSIPEAIKLLEGHAAKIADHPNLAVELARCFLEMQLYDRAIIASNLALDLDASNQQALATRALAFQFSKQLANALADLQKITTPDNTAHNFSCQKLMLALQLARWDEVKSSTGHIFNGIHKKRIINPEPFPCLHATGIDDHALFLLTRETAKARTPDKSSLLTRPPRNQANSKIRIGYLSGDFYEHATMILLIGVIECHNRSDFEIHAFSHSPQHPSQLRQRTVDAFDFFHEISHLSNLDAAKLIQSKQIDILIDLKGWTGSNRLDILSYRPAPIQANWLGFPGTTGAQHLAQYIIGDKWVTPLARQCDFHEKILQLPHCYQPNDNKRHIPNPSIRKKEGLPQCGFIFCSFNQMQKINQPVFDAWIDILSATPESYLWLLKPDREAKETLIHYAEKRGVRGDRLIFAERLPPEKHLSRLQLADCALDTFPYNSHTTASDALWVGIPVITFPGASFASRVASSILDAAGLNELIGSDINDYIKKAITIAQDKNYLSAVKRRLAEKKSTCPLFDTESFTKDLEALLMQTLKDSPQ